MVKNLGILVQRKIRNFFPNPICDDHQATQVPQILIMVPPNGQLALVGYISCSELEIPQ